MVRTLQDVGRFESSEVYGKLTQLVEGMQAAAVGKRLSDECAVSPLVGRALGMLEAMGGWVDEIPPLDQPMRYGNKAYRLWHDRLQADGPALVLALLPPELHPAATELHVYLAGCFGDPTRIDYGTGHETCFLAFMLCLAGAFHRVRPNCTTGPSILSDNPYQWPASFAHNLGQPCDAMQYLFHRARPARQHGPPGVSQGSTVPSKIVSRLVIPR